MKTSIFDMNFTLPPLIEMHEVTKDMPMGTGWDLRCPTGNWFFACHPG
jgi:hypothetical protein